MNKLAFFLLSLLVVFGLFTIWYKENSASKQTVYVLLGPPGAGKGVQAIKLSQKLHLTHISTGDLFRENIRNKTAYGEQAKALIEAGQLAPDELELDMLFDRVAKVDCENGYILDGFPRTIPQAEALQKRLEQQHAKLIVLNFQASDAVVVDRIAGRMVCKGCPASYNKKELNGCLDCSNCNGQLYQRSDDNAEVVLNRLQVYYKETKPLEEYYGKRIIQINSELNTDAVFNQLMQKIAE